MLWLLLSCLTAQKKAPLAATTQSKDNVQNTIAIPIVGKAAEFTPPAPSTLLTEKGSTVLLITNPKLPLINLSIVLPGGYLHDDIHWGRADTVSSILLKSTKKNDMSQQSILLREQGAQVDISLGERHTTIELMVHKDNLSTTLPLISDMIFQPLFSQEEWDSHIEYRSSELTQSYEDAAQLAFTVQNIILYPQDHPLHRLPEGSPKYLSMLRKEDVQKWHYSRLDPKQVGIMAVGDIQAEELLTALNTHINQWSDTTFPSPDLNWSAQTNTGFFFIDLPEEQQSNLRVLIPQAKPPTENDIVQNTLLGIAMGGSFTSRLNNKLREEKGYTYGARCSFVELQNGVLLYANTSVRRDATAPALNDFLTTLSSAKEGFSQEEWQKSKNTMRNNIISQYESRERTVSSIERSWKLQKDNQIDQLRLQMLKELGDTPPTAYNDTFTYQNGVVIVTGDGQKIQESLSDISFTTVDLEKILQ